jgi:hypothetical protein
MNEDAVKASVSAWLTPQGYAALPEFVVAGGRLDFLGTRWIDDGRQLEVVGVECKGTPTAAEVWGITSEQLNRYTRIVPRLYFACFAPEGEPEDGFAALCRIAGVGFLAVRESGVTVAHKPPDISTRFDPDGYTTQVRAPVVLRHAFRETFGPDVRLGTTWIATPEPNNSVQWNGYLDAARSAIYLGVNIENARQVLGKVDPAALVSVLSGIGGATFSAGQDRYFGPGRRATIPILEANADAISPEEVAYLIDLSARVPIHLTIGIPAWSLRETRQLSWYLEALAAARARLDPVRAALLSG